MECLESRPSMDATHLIGLSGMFLVVAEVIDLLVYLPIDLCILAYQNLISARCVA